MSLAGIVGLISAGAVAVHPVPADTEARAKLSRQMLKGCGAAEENLVSFPDEDWTPSASAQSKHEALRKSLNEPMPVSQSSVSIHAIGGDLATTEFSVILTRKVNGIWAGTAVGQSKRWIEGAKPTAMPRREWTLPEAKGRRLDALLADKCLYAEPTTFFRQRAPGVGSIYMSVETRTLSHQRQFLYNGENVQGLSREVTELTFPPAS